MEKNIVTKVEAENKVAENFETLQTAHGKVRVNKRFFAVCAGIGTVCTGVGVAGLVTLGFVLAPIAATGLGVVTLVTSGAFYRGEKKEEKNVYDQAERNQELYRRIQVKDAMNQEAKEKKNAKQADKQKVKVVSK